MSKCKFDTPAQCEHVRNTELQEIAELLSRLDDEGIKHVFRALLVGDEAMGPMEPATAILLRKLALPTVLAELQRRLELEELEDHT